MTDKIHINVWAQVYFQQHFVTSHKCVPIILICPVLRSIIMFVFKILHHFTAFYGRCNEAHQRIAHFFMLAFSVLKHWIGGYFCTINCAQMDQSFFFSCFFVCQVLCHLFVYTISVDCTWRKITMKYVFYPFIVERVTQLRSWLNRVISHFYSSNPFVFVLVSGRSTLKGI